MTKEREDGSLYELIGSIYERHNGETLVQPSWLATLAMKEIGASQEANPRWYLAGHLEFRQIARSFCAKRNDPIESDTADLFAGTLQDRYPQAPGPSDDEPIYVRREKMTAADVAFNVARMRKTALALTKHADTLEDWANRRFREVA